MDKHMGLIYITMYGGAIAIIVPHRLFGQTNFAGACAISALALGVIALAIYVCYPVWRDWWE